MATLLGLSFHFHDSAAALVRDGRVVAAAAEERFCRRKHTNEFPKQALDFCLEAGQLDSINQVDAIVFYEKPIMKLHRVVETLIQVWPRGLGTFARRLPSFLTTKFNASRAIEKALPGYQGPILFSEHHLSHAASAFYCSPFDNAAILTVDGVGEWETTTLGVGRGQTIELRQAIHFPHSIGLLYSGLTSYLGFRVNDGEWKVMGLAPYGVPKYVEQFWRLVSTSPDGSYRLNMEYFAFHYSSKHTVNRRRWQELFGFGPREPGAEIEQRHEDLARSGQVVVEEMVLALAREAKRISQSDNLVIAGGVGLNSVANYKVEREGIFENVWIQPGPGDDGGAIGAALVASQLMGDPPCPEMTNAFTGPEFSPVEIDSFLASRGIPHTSHDDDELVERVADLIAAGKVVGWFQGRMEFGPRALGARSILADATKAEMKAVINSKIKYREYFRPFAPAVPKERAHEFFEVEPGADLPFMLKVPPVRAEKRGLIPAVTHEDGSGRVQTVTEQDNPLYYRVLVALESRTGAPIAINTSFNVRGEPIVCTPEDAYSCFVRTGIDVLVLGNCLLLEKPDGQIDHAEGYARSDALEAAIGENQAEIERAPATILTSAQDGGVQEKVLNFYKELPFNYYSNAVDTAVELSRDNRLQAYPVLHEYLLEHRGARVIDVGCGAGWFTNSCAHYYGATAVGLDLNPVVLKQARGVARLMAGCESVRFHEGSVFEFQPGEPFDVVNSLGVLHHTPDCHGAIKRVIEWIAPGGHLHLGLYHEYGRRPFLDHFAKLQEQASEAELYDEFARLNPNITDATHMRSWFRDQVLHPHETQHTYEEIHALLESQGCIVESTSINRFGPLPPLERTIEMERGLEQVSLKSLYKEGRYFPGFFVVWARKP
jgi:carbamoyltransferase